jgi:peptide subunit release factor 1 (eRF1)
MGAVNDVTVETLRELAGMRAEGETVLSTYLDLDPAQFATPPARASEIDSLLDQAHREIEDKERPHGELMALRGALERTREMLRPRGSVVRGAHALALFACEPLDLARTLRLPQPVVRAAVVSDAPFIAPLVEQGPAGRLCVALIDERFARILTGTPERLREAVSFGDPVHGRHEQGGWSQARYQRSVDESVSAHLRRVGRVLYDLLRVSPYDRQLIGCTEPLWPRVLAELHPDVRAVLTEQRLSIDVSDASIGDVERAAVRTLAVLERAREKALLVELRERHARRNGRAAAGLAAVLRALVERRVETLLYDAGLDAGGVVCPRCGWMELDGERCPVEGQRLQPRRNIIEEAVQAAVRQSAEVLALRDRPELGPYGGVAAMLRF